MLVDAPREVNIVRSSVKKAVGEKVDEYKKEEGTSQEAQKYGSTTQFNSNEC